MSSPLEKASSMFRSPEKYAAMRSSCWAKSPLTMARPTRSFAFVYRLQRTRRVVSKIPEGAVHLAGCGRPTLAAVAVSLFSHHIPLSIVVLAGAGDKGNPAPHGPGRFAQPFLIARIIALICLFLT